MHTCACKLHPLVHIHVLCINSVYAKIIHSILTKPSGPIFGARDDVAPTSPPTALKHTTQS